MEEILQIENAINDKEQFIGALFENGIRNTIANCRRDFSLARPYQFPIPITYDGFSDWRNVRQRYIEKTCQAQIMLAHSLCEPIKDRVSFYDLICFAYPSEDVEFVKYLYSEILKYTTDNRLFDSTVTNLKLLNDQIESEKTYSISPNALQSVNNLDILPKDDKGNYDLYAIRFKEFVFINKSTVLIKFIHDCYYRNNLKEITLKINGVFGAIELNDLFSETSFGLKISKNYAFLNIQAHALTKDFKLLDIKAKGIEVLECNDIEFPDNPFH